MRQLGPRVAPSAGVLAPRRIVVESDDPAGHCRTVWHEALPAHLRTEVTQPASQGQ